MTPDVQLSCPDCGWFGEKAPLTDEGKTKCPECLFVGLDKDSPEYSGGKVHKGW